MEKQVKTICKECSGFGFTGSTCCEEEVIGRRCGGCGKYAKEERCFDCGGYGCIIFEEGDSVWFSINAASMSYEMYRFIQEQFGGKTKKTSGLKTGVIKQILNDKAVVLKVGRKLITVPVEYLECC